MARSEYYANEVLAARAQNTSWKTPAPVRKAAKKSFIRRLLGL